MPFTVYADHAQFDTDHERQALDELIQALDARFGAGVDPVALCVNVHIGAARIDLLALTARAIVVIDLKNVTHPDTVIDGAQNGKWYADPPGHGRFEINRGRSNPYKQLDTYRFTLMDWFKQNAKTVFGTQRAAQLDFRQISARVVITPSINRVETLQRCAFLTSEVGKWFDIIGLDMVAQDLHNVVSPGIALYAEQIAAIAQQLRLVPNAELRESPSSEEPNIPERHLFSRPPVVRVAVGRDLEFETVRQAVDSKLHTLIVISGVGGVGKTHLAARVADELMRDRTVYWVYCDDHRDLTLDTLLLAFAGKHPNPDLARILARTDEKLPTRLEVLVDFLEDQHAVVILDDFHLLDNDLGLLELFQRIDLSTRETNVILTVRRRPDFQDDTVKAIKSGKEITLMGLPVEQVSSFLRSRTDLNGPKLTIKQEREIWSKTGGGNPQVLIFLAKLSEGSSPTVVAHSLNVFDDTSAHEWYEMLLRPLSRLAYQLARKLCVLRGVISLALVQAFHGQEPVALILAELRNHYIIQRADTPNSFVMTTLVQDFLYSQLGADHKVNFHRQAGRYLFELSQNPPQGYNAIDLQTEAIYHAYHAHDWRRILSSSRSVVTVLSKAGETQRARTVCERALAAAQATKSRSDEAFWHLELAHQLRRLDQIEAAAHHCNRGMTLAEALKDQALLANAHYQLGVVNQRVGNLKEAQRCHALALELNRSIGDTGHVADSLGRLGSIARAERDNDRALAYYEESIALYRQIENITGVGITYTQMGTLAKYNNDHELAVSYFQQALDIAAATNNIIGQAIALQSLAEVAYRRGDIGDALDLIERALVIHAPIPLGYSYRIALGTKIDVLLAGDRLEEAEEIMPTVEELCIKQGDPLGQIFNVKRRGQIDLLRGNRTSGIAKLQEAVAMFLDKGHKQYSVDCNRLIAQATQE
jgi:tetratricopeptide (TPR) repeat protein/nucleoside-triphosphatase THEP1